MFNVGKFLAKGFVGLAILAAPAFAQNLITNGDFATNSYANWNINTQTGGTFNAASGQSVWTSSTAGTSTGQLTQAITGLVVGQTYRITFDLINNTLNTVADQFYVQFDNAFTIFSGAGASNGTKSFTQLYTGNGNLILFGMDAAGVGRGWTFDNVSLVNAVPELNALGATVPFTVLSCAMLLAYDRKRRSVTLTTA